MIISKKKKKWKIAKNGLATWGAPGKVLKQTYVGVKVDVTEGACT